jgi:hypothetical protein
MYYKLIITETSRNSLKDEPHIFNDFSKSFGSLEDLKDELINRYGKLPKGRNKIYRDLKNGQSIEIGFLHSYWNSDISHNSKSWYQTDWIEVRTVEEKPFLL